MKKFLLGLLMGGVVLAQAAVARADIYTNMASTVTGHVDELTGVVTTAVGAGLTIFALIWGIRKIKSAIRAGA